MPTPLAETQLDVSRAPTAAEVVATLIERAVEQMAADAPAAGLGHILGDADPADVSDSARRLLVRHATQLRRLHSA